MKIYNLISIAFLAVACKSIDLPTIEQSENLINQYKSSFEMAEKAIISKQYKIPVGNDLIFRTQHYALNKIFNTIANHHTEDVYIHFENSPNFFSEKKTVVGISYTNSINTDSGLIKMDIKKFNLNRIHNNTIDCDISISGTGKISISGVYTGVKARATPEIELTLDENLAFEIIPGMNDQIVLTPKPKLLNMKTKFTINLLSWKLPYSKNFAFQTKDLLKPIALPLIFTTEFNLPPISQSNKTSNSPAKTYRIRMNNSKINAQNNTIEYRADIKLDKK